MAQYKSLDPNTEAVGQTILSVVEGMGIFRGMAIKALEQHGISDIQPDQWYPQQAWLDAMKTIDESVGDVTIFEIGKKILNNAKLPPGIDSIEKALVLLDDIFQMNHRNGDAGHIHFEKTGERSGEVVFTNSYPCELERGILESLGEKFRTAGTHFVIVKHDDSQPCRKDGADACTYNISW